MLLGSLRLVLRTEAQILRGPLTRTSLHQDCPTAEAARPAGTTGEEAGPGRSSGEDPPSWSSWTSCVCLQAPQRKAELRVDPSSIGKQRLDYVPQSRTGVSRSLHTVQGALQTVQGGLQTVQGGLQTAVDSVNGDEVPTDLCPAAAPPDRPTTGTQKAPETEEDTAEKEGDTAGDTAGASRTKWWTGSGDERRCYDKEPLEG